MKKLLCLILLMGLALAQASIEKTDVTVSIDQTGNANVQEKITIIPDEKGIEIFNNLAERGETDFTVWKTLVPDLQQSIGTTEQPKISGTKKQITDTTYDYQISIEYSSPNFATLKSSEGRIETWQADNSRFVFYGTDTKKFIIPEKTNLQIMFDDTRKDKTKDINEFFQISPEGLAMGPYLQDNRVLFFINGPAFADDFSFTYKVERALAETTITQNFFSFFVQNPIYIVVLVLIIILLVVFRKQAVELLEETFISEDDIVLPRKK